MNVSINKIFETIKLLDEQTHSHYTYLTKKQMIEDSVAIQQTIVYAHNLSNAFVKAHSEFFSKESNCLFVLNTLPKYQFNSRYKLSEALKQSIEAFGNQNNNLEDLKPTTKNFQEQSEPMA